ncbi:MAG: hypothetical protein IJS65_05770 [Clostridia bacterium]|nr:hypothetical protein [Clostridia bacterium]
MKKAVYLFLALTLALSLCVPAEAGIYGEVKIRNLDSVTLTTDKTRDIFTFEEAYLDSRSVTVVALDRQRTPTGAISRTDPTGDGPAEKTVFADVPVVVVKPGSTTRAKEPLTSVQGYAKGADGLYHEVEKLFTLSGDVDEWFKNKSETEGLEENVTMFFSWYAFAYYEKYDGTNGCFIVMGEEEEPAPSPDDTPIIVPTSQNLTINGESRYAEIYNINGNNFFKLRDMAALLDGTGSQFSVDYDAPTKTITVKTGSRYSFTGDELLYGGDMSRTAVKSPQSLVINGKKVALSAFNIGGNNFFKLRELGEALNFDVDYEERTATMKVTSR